MHVYTSICMCVCSCIDSCQFMQLLVVFRLADLRNETLHAEYCQPFIMPSVWCPQELRRTSAGSASSWCTGGCPPRSLPLSSALWTRTFTVLGWTILRTRRLALAQRATQTVIFLPQLHLVPLLIAESWLEWCEERLAVWIERVYELRDKERKRGMKQGSWSLLVIRNWTAPSCLCSAQGWMSKQIQGRTFCQSFLVHSHFYFKTPVVPEPGNLCIGNLNRGPRLLLLKINWLFSAVHWVKPDLQDGLLIWLIFLVFLLFYFKWNVVTLHRCETTCRSTQSFSWFKADNDS